MKKFIIFILSLFFLFSGLNWENLVQVQVVDGVAKEYLDKEYIVKINFLNVLADDDDECDTPPCNGYDNDNRENGNNIGLPGGDDDDEGHDNEDIIVVNPTNHSPIVSPQSSPPIQNPLRYNTFGELINAIVDFIFNVAIVLVPLMILIGAFYFLTAAGDLKKITTGKSIIIYSLIGLAVILLAKGLISVIHGVLGVR